MRHWAGAPRLEASTVPRACCRGKGAASPLSGSGLGVLAPNKLLLGCSAWERESSGTDGKLLTLQCSSSGRLASDRSLSSAQQREVRWGPLCPAAGLYLGLGATMVSKKQQQELRDGADEKEKGKQGGLNTKQTGNLKLPSFHEHTTTEVSSLSRNLKMWLPMPGAGPRAAAPSRTPVCWHPNTHSGAMKREEGRTTGQNPACRSDGVRCPCAPRQYGCSCWWHCRSCTAASCPSSPGSVGMSPGSSEDCRESCAGKFSHDQFQEALRCKIRIFFLYFFFLKQQNVKENGLSTFILVLFLPAEWFSFPPHLPGHYLILLFFFLLIITFFHLKLKISNSSFKDYFLRIVNPRVGWWWWSITVNQTATGIHNKIQPNS